MPQTGALRTLRDEAQINRAIVFLHGFTGRRDDTWGTFPNLLGTEIGDWNIFTLGYATTFLPDVVGIWSADPDLTILAELFRSELLIPPLDRHGSVVIVARLSSRSGLQPTFRLDLCVASAFRALACLPSLADDMTYYALC